ncbi:MAG: Ca-activated chloride channel [Chthoniobacter sp.]|jgi:Ca-activated chloride channel family protein|nr:Ca-activated chloride channel [Chthoniobacter sp.]
MKTFLLSMGLAAVGVVRAFAGETVQLHLQPDQRVLLTGDPREVVVKIDLAATGAKTRGKRGPVNIVAVLDRSGSMSGAKLEKAKQGVVELIDQLGESDTFALVVYDSTVQVVVPAQHIEDREELKRRVERIHSGGSTALYGGVERGAAELEKFCSASSINRVILLSDGLANIGPSSTEDLRGLGRRLAARGLSVSTIGVGDDYNEDLMSAIAEASDANYYYVRDAEKLPQIFAKELGQLLAVTARDIRIEIACPDGVEPIDLIGRPEKFSRRKAVVQLSPLASSQTRYLFLRCKVAEPREIERRDLATVTLSYLDEQNGSRPETMTQTVQVGFTNDSQRAMASADTTIVAERELQLNALVKDKAMGQSDAGKNKEAAQVLNEQAEKLDAAASRAPEKYAAQFKEEAKNARDRAGQIAEAPMTATMRKQVQSESYQQKNAKQ